MKNLLLAIPLLLATPACRVLDEIADVPAAVVGDVGDAVTTDEAVQAQAEATGSTVGTIVTLGTGNPAIGAGAAALVTAGILFLKRRKK